MAIPSLAIAPPEKARPVECLPAPAASPAKAYPEDKAGEPVHQKFTGLLALVHQLERFANARHTHSDAGTNP
jgi:hypothetical protein